MNNKYKRRNAIALIYLIIIVVVIIVIGLLAVAYWKSSVMYKEKLSNENKYTSSMIIGGDEYIGYNEYKKDEKLEGMKEIALVKGLYMYSEPEEIEGAINSFFQKGSYNLDKNITTVFLYKDDFYISEKKLENILGYEISYDSENIYIGSILKINRETGIMTGTNLIEFSSENQKISLEPIIKNNTVFLPLKCIIQRFYKEPTYYDADLNILRIFLTEYEQSLLNNCPYSIVGNYVSTEHELWTEGTSYNHYDLIYKKDDKYGIMSYSIDKSNSNKITYNLETKNIYDKIYFTRDDFNNYFLYKDNKISIYNRTIKRISEKFSEVEHISSDYLDKYNSNYNIYKVKKDGKYGLYSFSESEDNLFKFSEIIYDDIYYEETGEWHIERFIYGIINDNKILIQKLNSRDIDL